MTVNAVFIFARTVTTGYSYSRIYSPLIKDRVIEIMSYAVVLRNKSDGWLPPSAISTSASLCCCVKGSVFRCCCRKVVVDGISERAVTSALAVVQSAYHGVLTKVDGSVLRPGSLRLRAVPPNRAVEALGGKVVSWA